MEAVIQSGLMEYYLKYLKNSYIFSVLYSKGEASEAELGWPGHHVTSIRVHPAD